MLKQVTDAITRKAGAAQAEIILTLEKRPAKVVVVAADEIGIVLHSTQTHHLTAIPWSAIVSLSFLK